MSHSDRTTKPQTRPGEQILKSAQERAARLLLVWEMSAEQRVQAMRKGELSLEQCAAWAARYPEQVPLLNGEFEYLAALTPEVHEWQTDREHAYVAVSRAREQTQIYTSREDLGEQGMDTGALERLAQRIERSRAQEATINKETAAEREDDRLQAERDPQQFHQRRRVRDRVADEDGIVRDPRTTPTERGEQPNTRPLPQATPSTGRSLPDIRTVDPKDLQVTVVDHGDTQLAYSNAYDLTSHTGKPTVALFGGWQTEHTLGYIAVAQNGEGRTEVQISNEERGDRELETELKDAEKIANHLGSEAAQ